MPRLNSLAPPSLAARQFPLGVLTLLGTLTSLSYFTAETAVTTALRIVLATLAVGIVPGLLVSALLAPLAAGTLLEWFGIAFGISFVLVQLLTLLAILAHLSCSLVLKALLLACGIAAVGLLFKPDRNRLVIAPAAGQWVIGAALIALAVCLYIASPTIVYWIGGEDALHIGVIRRMVSVERPALDNLYWARDFVYTYPFPGTHFFMALVSRAAHVDPLFVYHKLRFFWGPASICLIYALARVTFASARVAFASALAATLLTMNGTFGPISSSWGQLVPNSHASDVAMTLLLPALLLFVMHFILAKTAKASACFFVAAITMALTLAIVHVRELVQFFIYAAAACAVFATVPSRRRLALRLGVLTAVTLALAEAYLLWHKHVVGHIDFVVEQRRDILVDVIKTMPLVDYVRAPFLNPYFSAAHEFFFYQWLPILLFLAPIVILAYAARPLVAFVGASMLAYLLIVRLPLLTIPYIYVTYYEIMFTPVRNFLVFIYMTTGALLLVFADMAGRLRARWAQSAAVAAMIAALWLAHLYAGAFFQKHQELFLLPMIAALAMAMFGWPRLTWLRQYLAVTDTADERAPLPWTYFLLVIGVAALSVQWDKSPLNVHAEKAVYTASEYFTAIPQEALSTYGEFVDPVSGLKQTMADTTVQMSVPPPEFLQWAAANLSTDAVIASNLFTYPLPVFLPQRIPLWPVVDGASTLEFNARLVPAAYARFSAAVVKHQSQPVFNDRETLDERLEYLRAVGATHLLLDPKYYAVLRGVLGAAPGQFVQRYDDGQRWALFEIRQRAPAPLTR